MNNKKAFVSDFDGTFSKKDFYHIIIDKYLGQEGIDFYIQWKKEKKINVEFLNIIFSQINMTEEELFQEIKQIPIDEYVVSFLKKCKKNNFDFYIVSAGTSYYINLLLKHLEIKEIKVISMDGVFADRGIKILPSQEDIYYSDTFGIDKGKVINDLKQIYDKVYFAGDSEPDYYAAVNADLAFGKNELKELLKKEKKEFIGYDNFLDIEKKLVERQVIK